MRVQFKAEHVASLPWRWGGRGTVISSDSTSDGLEFVTVEFLHGQIESAIPAAMLEPEGVPRLGGTSVDVPIPSINVFHLNSGVEGPRRAPKSDEDWNFIVPFERGAAVALLAGPHKGISGRITQYHGSRGQDGIGRAYTIDIQLENGVKLKNVNIQGIGHFVSRSFNVATESLASVATRSPVVEEMTGGPDGAGPDSVGSNGAIGTGQPPKKGDPVRYRRDTALYETRPDQVGITLEVYENPPGDTRVDIQFADAVVKDVNIGFVEAVQRIKFEPDGGVLTEPRIEHSFQIGDRVAIAEDEAPLIGRIVKIEGAQIQVRVEGVKDGAVIDLSARDLQLLTSEIAINVGDRVRFRREFASEYNGRYAGRVATVTEVKDDGVTIAFGGRTEVVPSIPAYMLEVVADNPTALGVSNADHTFIDETTIVPSETIPSVPRSQPAATQPFSPSAEAVASAGDVRVTASSTTRGAGWSTAVGTLAPAADRVVRIDHNSQEVQDVKSALDTLIDRARGANDLSADPNDRLAYVSEVEDLRRAMEGPFVRVRRLYDAIQENGAIKWLADKGVGGIVGQLATAAATAILMWMAKLVF